MKISKNELGVMPPLFICGFPSGGTDLLKSILNAHPDIYINGEMPFLTRLLNCNYSSDLRLDSNTEIERLRNILIKIDVYKNIENINSDLNIPFNGTLNDALRYWFNDSEKLIWGNKTPQNSENINDLLRLFPTAKFILIVRDVRDVCLSWNRKWGKNMYGCSEKWATRMKFVLDSTNDLSVNQVLIIRYEELISDTFQTTKIISNFLNIIWSDRMLSPETYVSKIIDGKKNYGNKIIKDNLSKWRKELTIAQAKRIEGFSFNTLSKLEYDIKYALSQKRFTFFHKIFYSFWDFSAIIFVGNRYSKHNDIKSRLNSIVHEIRKKFL